MDPTDQHLIEFVEKCPHLYNKSSPDYKDKIKAQNSWCSIAEAFNATAADCEHRWSQLRERFTRERRLLKAGLPSGSGSSKQSTPSDLYKALQFLEPHIKSRRTRGNVLKKPLSSSEESAMWETLETYKFDVIEYINSLDNKKIKLEMQVEDKFKEVEDDILKVESSDENNINLLNVKASAFNKTHTDIVKTRKTLKTSVSAEDDALHVVSEALQSVKGLCESADKCDNVAYNFCMTTYSQFKNMSKKKLLVPRLIPLC